MTRNFVNHVGGGYATMAIAAAMTVLDLRIDARDSVRVTNARSENSDHEGVEWRWIGRKILRLEMSNA